MNNLFRNAVLAAAIACAPLAFAAPVTLSAGQALVWNVDLTSTLPGAPPFTSVTFNTGLPSFPTATGVWEFFADHDLQGGGAGDPAGLVLLSRNWGDPGVVDGIFSVRVTVTSGSVDLDPWAFGSLNGVDGAEVRWEPDAMEVPEPATLSLACLGLLAAAAMRRRTAA